MAYLWPGEIAWPFLGQPTEPPAPPEQPAPFCGKRRGVTKSPYRAKRRNRRKR
jgi:hypothetical protein